jgi:hypothetical protein
MAQPFLDGSATVPHRTLDVTVESLEAVATASPLELEDDTATIVLVPEPEK